MGKLTYVGEKVEGVLDHDGVTARRDAVLQLLDHVLLTQIRSEEFFKTNERHLHLTTLSTYRSSFYIMKPTLEDLGPVLQSITAKWKNYGEIKMQYYRIKIP